ncbi:MAG: ABC transporter ATP-binding protein, partial [Lachnospiraceae bacterium]|nr:ABC transporter ATP-binding protein [Lachnospiraceae bacterium]
SGGQQQRVGGARALVVEPEIIFADEPTGNLDSNTSVEVMNLMKRVVREKNQTLVMVTHDNYLAGFADVIIRIRDGKILEVEDHSGEEMPDEIVAQTETAESLR